MKARSRIPAGVIDSGLASLATFGVGLFAIHSFDPALLGGYALAFAAFNLLVILPRELVFVPAEIAAVTYASEARLSLIGRTLSLGLLPALAAAVMVSFWSLAAPADIPTTAIFPVTVTTAICTFLSPVQDHLRRMLHIGERSWLATAISVIQVAMTALAVVVAVRLEVPAAWIPFGALAVANLVSLAVGGAMLGLSARSEPPDAPALQLSALVISGKWLLVGGLLGPASVFVASVLVTHLAGAEALGFAEAARVISRPLPVLAAGISAVLRPLSIEAAQKKQLPIARHASRLYLKLMGACGLLYLLVAGADVPWNPLAAILPNGYMISGLAAATIIAETFSVLLFPYRYELLGGDRVVALTVIEGVGAFFRCVVTAIIAGMVASFAMPLGLMIMTVARGFGFHMKLRGLYEPESERPRPDEEAVHPVSGDATLVRG